MQNPEPTWFSLLACPACRADLDSLERCAACGTAFGEHDGLPLIWSPELETTLPFTHTAARSAVDRESLNRVLRDPEPVLSDRALPFHLHPAHAEILSRMPTGSSVLEVGCGGGQNRNWLREQAIDYVGIDASREGVFEHLQRFGGPDFFCDAHFLPFRDASFDSVYSAAVLEHLASPRIAVHEMFRTLKPGGSCLGTVAFLEPLHDDNFFNMSPVGVLELLTAQGFEVSYIWPGERYWSVFYAVPAMIGRWPLRWIRHLGRALAGLYSLQNRALNLLRALVGRPRIPEIVTRSAVAGSVYWIAHKPNRPVDSA